jgi:hypothetical protein
MWRIAIACFGLHLSTVAHAAQDDETIDFTGQITPVCEVEKLKVSPPVMDLLRKVAGRQQAAIIAQRAPMYIGAPPSRSMK